MFWSRDFNFNLTLHFTNLSHWVCSAFPVDIVDDRAEIWKDWNDQIAAECPPNQQNVVLYALMEHLFGQQHFSMRNKLRLSLYALPYLFHRFC